MAKDLNKVRDNTKLMTNPELRGKNKAPLNRLQREELSERIIEWICRGESRADIQDLVRKHSSIPLTDRNVRTIMEHAMSAMEEISKQDASKVVLHHVDLYEDIYKYFIKIGHAAGANKAMRAKEKLLGLLKDNNKLSITAKKTTTIVRKVDYDISKLNDPEKRRLQELLNKCK